MKRIRVVCLLRDQFSHVTPVERSLGESAKFLYDENWDPAGVLATAPDVVVCVNDFHYEVARCLEAARRAAVPSLVLQDGILEWRCQYENPRFASGTGAPQHQPVMADKIACMGPQSARQIARWGNVEKVEVTGMPRMEAIKSRRFSSIRKPGRTVLVMTAKKPGFTPEQTEITLRSLRDLKEEISRLEGVEVIWRITKGLHETLGVENRFESAEPMELADLLEEADAVITTPSTAMVEAMVAGRPVAVLDYHNVPRFVCSAWSVTAREHMLPVLHEILDPPARKMAFQEDCRDDVLFSGDGTARVGELITLLAEAGRRARGKGSTLQLPANMLGYDWLVGTGGRSLGLADLYPSRESFAEKDLGRLQAMLARAEAEVQLLRTELQRRKAGYWIQWGIMKLVQVARRRR